MYWAKKILEWTKSPEDALKEGMRLNDRYALDGNNLNGYVRVMWSCAGIHDQGWAARAMFGKVRYMNYLILFNSITLHNILGRAAD